jgi:GNAT superfamily N-acetyltransferase
MGSVRVRKGRKADSTRFLGLVRALADFEHLEPPSRAAQRRLVDDIFRTKRLNLFVATDDGEVVGYALYFYTYSSFLAKPTLYLEDIYVKESHRKIGAGRALFRRCVEEAVAKGCGRMEWAVLTWNQAALRFYEKLGARRLSDWYVYRLDEKGLAAVPGASR